MDILDESNELIKRILPLKTMWGCLVAGTPVLMADGSVKKIESVGIGEHVSYCEQTAMVRNTWSSSEFQVVQIAFAGGELRLTASQPVLVLENGVHRLLCANAVVSGTVLLSADGREYPVISVTVDHYMGKVYNLSLEGDEHLFVSTGILMPVLWNRNIFTENSTA